jgi:hypothetical protein
LDWELKSLGAIPGAAEGQEEEVELVGTNLRMTGTMSLGRWGRLSDLVDHAQGYLRIHDARLLRRNGEPTSLVLSELLVDQDEISFIAQAVAPKGAGTDGDPSGLSTVERRPRRLVMFTPGHVVTGSVHMLVGGEVANFAEATEPRFVPTTEVTTRSLSDRRIIGHYEFALVNRTQMIAIAEESGGDVGSKVSAEISSGDSGPVEEPSSL